MPNYLLGKHLKQVTLYAGSQDADTGAYTWSATPNHLKNGLSSLGVVDFISVSDDRVLDMITPVDAQFAHYEEVLKDFSISIGEILQGAALAKLPDLIQAGNLFKVVFIRGAGATTKTYTYYGRVRNFKDGVTSQGKNTCEAVLAPVYDGTNAPLAYT